MKKRTLSLLLCVAFILAALCSNGCAEQKPEPIKGISEAGNEFYFNTIKYVADLTAFDFSHLFNDKDFVEHHEDNYSLRFGKDGTFSATYSLSNSDMLDENSPITGEGRGIFVEIDKSYKNLTPEKIRLKFQPLLAQGFLTSSELDSIIEAGFLEKISYRYRLCFFDYDDYHYFYYDAYVFSSQESAEEAHNFLKTFALPSFYNKVIYGNQLIEYRALADPSKSGNIPIKEPDSNLIKEIKTGLEGLIKILQTF